MSNPTKKSFRKEMLTSAQMESLKKPHKTLWMVEYFHDLWQSGELLCRETGKP